MDLQSHIGLGARRILTGLIWEIAVDDIVRARMLLSAFSEWGVLGFRASGFAEFNTERAALSVRNWLSDGEQARVLAASVHVAEDTMVDLCIWERADVALPLAARSAEMPAWFRDLADAGLVHSTPRGWRMSPLLRLYVWLGGIPPAPAQQAMSSLFSVAFRRYRALGRWHEAARLARAALHFRPELLHTRPAILITMACGLVQTQEFELLTPYLDGWSEQASGPLSASQAKWRGRLWALKVFCEMESGSLVNAGEMLAAPSPPNDWLREPIWHHLLSAWLNIRLGQHARAARCIRALLRLKPNGLGWLESVVRSWLATAYHYLEDYRLAREQSMGALAAAVAAGWHERVLTMRINLAIALLETGSTGESLQILRSLQRCHEIDHRHLVLSGVLSTLAQVLNNKVAIGSGAWENRRALKLSEEEGLWQRSMFIHESEAMRASRSGKRDIAEYHRQQAVHLVERQGDSLVSANTLWQRARRLWCDGQTGRALSLYSQAIHVFTRLKQASRRADLRCDLAMCHFQRGWSDLAAEQIELARQDYGTQQWSREAGFVEMLELEGQMRRSPGSVQEAQVNALRVVPEATKTQLAYAYSLMALGFALIGDNLTTREMAKTTVGHANNLRDPFITNHILNLANELRKSSTLCALVLSYWEKTFLQPDSPDSRESYAQ
jgi:tetratricopeptide (TPR) repeat protein